MAAGTEVVCAARGESGAVPDGAVLARVDRARPSAYDDLAGDWDEVVDVADDPAFVRSAVDALGDRSRHWTFVSSVSVYARSDEPGADESAEVVEPGDLTRFPDAKVAAERALDVIADRLLVVRPGLIVGPGDPSDRFGYWPARFALGGTVLLPDATDRAVQVIDVDDLGAWIGGELHRGATGAVNAVGPSHAMNAFFEQVPGVTGFTGEVVQADDPTLVGHGVRYWSGPRSLPL